MVHSLKSKTVLVTGGAGGLGKAIATAFLKAEANVVILDINADLIATTTAELSSLGSFHAIKADITDEAAVSAAIQEAITKFGDLDVLINNAGIMDKFDPIGDVDMAHWDRVLKVNLTAPATLSKYAISHWEKREKGPKGGVIVNIGSVAGQRGFSAGAAYTTSKHGLVGLTRNTAAFYRTAGIRCNILMPGGMNTNISTAFSNGLNQKGLDVVLQGQKVVAEMSDLDQMGATAVFLAHEDSWPINGAVISADNGWNAV